MSRKISNLTWKLKNLCLMRQHQTFRPIQFLKNLCPSQQIRILVYQLDIHTSRLFNQYLCLKLRFLILRMVLCLNLFRKFNQFLCLKLLIPPNLFLHRCYHMDTLIPIRCGKFKKLKLLIY